MMNYKIGKYTITKKNDKYVLKKDFYVIAMRSDFKDLFEYACIRSGIWIK